MALKMKLCLIISLQLCFILVCNAKVDYFDAATWTSNEYLDDPHSFYYDKHTKKENLPPGDNNNHDVGKFIGGDATSCYAQLHKCKTAKNTDVADELLSRRFINMLVSRANFKQNGLYFSGRIHLEATPAQFEGLKNFGLGKLTLREVDSILNKVINSEPFDPIHESAMWIHSAGSFVWNFLLEHKEWVIGVIAVSWLYRMLRGTRFNFFLIMTIGVQFILVASFFITWWRLIQDAQIKHAAVQIKNMVLPVQCQPHKMGWMDTVRSWFYTDDCEKYFEAQMRDPMLQVTPAQALSHMLSTIMWEPLTMSGKIIGGFLDQLTAHMPFWMRLIVQLSFCLGIFPTIIILIILLLGGSLNFGFGPLSVFSLRGPQNREERQSERLESKKERQPIEVMLNVTANVQLPPSVTNAAERSNNLAIKECPECSGQKKEDTICPEVVTRDDQAGGDSVSTTRAGSSKTSADKEVEGGVRMRKIVELGSGDHHRFTID